MLARTLAALCLFLLPALALGQPLRLTVRTLAVGSSEAPTPLWLQGHRDGLVRADGATFLVQPGLVLPLRADRSVNFGAGARLTAQHTGNVYFTELYGRLGFAGVELRAGRYAEVHGEIDERLSTGSFTLSRNAVPVPRVSIQTQGYQPLPFTDGWVEAQGSFGHGWMEAGRYTHAPYLHQKFAYLRVGAPSPVQVHIGLHHSALWGGEHPEEGRLPQSLNDYLRVVIGQRGGPDAPVAERGGRLGAHLGMWDFGLTYTRGDARFRLYRHFTFDDPFGFHLKTPQDGILGLAYRTARPNALLGGVLYEYLYTKRQADRPDPETLGQISNYYNNYLYVTGYTHEGRTLGNPLLFVPDRDHNPPSDLTISQSNRIVAHHVGVEGAVLGVRYRTLLTYGRHYGNWADRFRAEQQGVPYRFDKGPRQVSGLFETDTALPFAPGLRLTLGIGLERGEVRGDAVGGIVGLRWEREL